MTNAGLEFENDDHYGKIKSDKEKYKQALECIANMKIFPSNQTNLVTLNAAISIARKVLVDENY